MSERYISSEQHRYVGTKRPLIDGTEEACGRAEYVDDIALTLLGLLHAEPSAVHVHTLEVPLWRHQGWRLFLHANECR
jgi:hypothetical protein